MHRIKSVGVLSCAKMFGVLYGCIGLIFIPFALLGGFVSLISQQKGGALGGAALLLIAVFFPFVYGGMGFLLGGLMAWLYNLVAGWVGGIELELIVSGVTPTPTGTVQG